jgi:MFS family permease
MRRGRDRQTAAAARAPDFQGLCRSAVASAKNAITPCRPDQAAVRPARHNVRWLIVGTLSLLAATNYLDRGNLSVAAPLIMHDLHITNTLMGVILSSFVWPYAIVNLPTGWAIDRFGARFILAVAAGCWSVVAALTGLARSATVFIGLRMSLGVCEAPLFPAALKATNAWFPDREKAAATGVYIAATQVGLALAPLLATVLISLVGWQMMFVAMGALGLLAAAGWLVIYQEPDQQRWLHPEELRYIRSGQRPKEDTPAEAASVSLREWGGLFRHATVWGLMAAAFCLQYVFWFYITWLPTYLQRAQKFDLHRAGMVAALPYVAGSVAVLLGGRASDWLIGLGVDTLTARRSVIAVSALMTAGTMLATVFYKGSTGAIMLLTLGMFTYSLSSASYWALATAILKTPRCVASIASIQNFGGFLGGACAPILTGVAVDRFGGFRVALLIAGGTALLASVLYGTVLHKRVPV